MLTYRRLLALCGFASLAMANGCDDHEFKSGHSSEETPSTDGYAGVQSIFQSSCNSCHSTGGTFPDLSINLCETIVGVDSQQASLQMVVAGDATNSYLFHKIEGTAGDAGGVDSIMPLGGALSTAEVTI